MGRLLLLIAVVVVYAGQADAVEKNAIDRAIANGVSGLRTLQQADGAWPGNRPGATALAGLTLLECGADKDDKAVQAAAANVRAASLSLTDTYSLALSVLFLDRLNVQTDTALIESMLVRLLAGQLAIGSWSYECPGLAAEEIRRLKAETNPARILHAGRDLSKLPAKGQRKPSDLPREIQAQLKAIAQGNVAGGARGITAVLGGDNSNTQFALIALWVGRRYGIPAQEALLRVDRYFRAHQQPDGGWDYVPAAPGASNSSATMTCAGLLGLGVGHGALLDIKKARDPKTETTDVSKDLRLKAGLAALATAIGQPTGWTGTGRPTIDIPSATGRAFYFLWSLERVAVAYKLETIGKKDWYQWGAELLLANQRSDGTWAGEFAQYGADTCFALLFLKRANFTRDLSQGLTGVKGLDTVMKAGGVGGSALTGRVSKGLALQDIGDKPVGNKPRTGDGDSARLPPGGAEKKPALTGESRTPEHSRPSAPKKSAAFRLTDELVQARGEQRASLLKKLRDTRGVDYTEALAGVIARLDAEGRRQAREALADRLTRMKALTLREYFKDDDVEIRRAAALAAAQQDSKSLIPDLIRLLSDPQPLVERAAHAALKELSGKDLGPRAGADRTERATAIADWLAWWKAKARE